MSEHTTDKTATDSAASLDQADTRKQAAAARLDAAVVELQEASSEAIDAGVDVASVASKLMGFGT
jgi:hypothetical protein